MEDFYWWKFAGRGIQGAIFIVHFLLSSNGMGYVDLPFCGKLKRKHVSLMRTPDKWVSGFLKSSNIGVRNTEQVLGRHEQPGIMWTLKMIAETLKLLLRYE